MNLLDVVYAVVVVVTFPWWGRKARQGWRERFGYGRDFPPKGKRARVLLHAVSVGEVSALRRLVPLLVDEVDVVISVTTDTGIRRARELFGETCDVVRYPLDMSGSVRRFLRAVQPDAVALVELEVWPNFVGELWRRRIPVAVINGRLSERSFAGYRRIRFFLKRTFGRLAFAAVQDEAYRARFVAMGVVPERCFVTGTMKWDAVDVRGVSGRAGECAERLAREMGIDRSKKLIVAGSTAAGEEALLHAACPAGVQLLCAPRKPERFEEAAGALAGCTRRSAGSAARAGQMRFLLDTIGELGAAYELADVVVIGRSFVPEGGSDPTEPIGLGKAVVAGRSMENFASIVGSLEEAGAIVRTDERGLAGVLAELVGDEQRRAGLMERGLACVREHQGASARHASLILEIAAEGVASRA